MSEKLTIFISYRRGDEQDFVERIRDWFVNRYGADNVFMDFAHIPPYVKFKDFIRERLQKSDVFIPIIGPRWLELLKAKADDDEEDYVLFEIESALKQGIMIAPIRIKGGMMPKKRDLPESIRELVDYNAPELVGGAAFLKDIQGLVEAVEIGWKQRKVGAQEARTEEEKKYESGTAKLLGEAKQREAERATKSMTKEEYVRRGIEKYNARDYDGAIADYTEAIHIDAKFATAYANRGIVYREKGDFDGAIRDYTEAIRLDPKFATAYGGRGIVYYDQDNYESAISDYNEAIRLDPKLALAYNNRGAARQAKGDLDGVLADYNEAIRLDPKFATAYLGRGVLYHFRLSNYPAALRDYEQYLALGGTDNRVAGWIREVKQKIGK